MGHGMMSDTCKAVCFLLIFCKIIEAQKSIDTFLTVIEAVQKFYLSPSTYVVFDSHGLDFTKEKILVEAITSQSKRDVMSQAITYSHLKKLSNRHENILYSLFIYDRENLERVINITKDSNMSMHPWLLYIKKATKFDCDKPDEKFFKLRIDTWMAAMCEGNPILKSYHGIFDNQTEVVDLAEWSSEKMQLEFKSERRLNKSHMDLKGITLRLTAKPIARVCQFTRAIGLPSLLRNVLVLRCNNATMAFFKFNRSIMTNDINDNIEKFNYEVIDEVANLSYFQTKVVAVDCKLGYLEDKTHEWYGMMKIMQEKIADIGLALFTMSRTRLKVVDYLIPLAKGHKYLYAKLPDDTRIVWTTYFKVFNKHSWTAIGITIFIFSILVYLMKNGFKHMSIRLFSEDFLSVWGIFRNQGPNDIDSSISMKVVYCSIFFTSLILNAIYSGSITSYITVLSPELPFSTYRQFLRDKSYNVIMVKGSREHSIVLENNTSLSPLQPHLKKYNLLPENSYKGFQQACKDKTAFYADKVHYDANRNYLTCKLGAVSMNRTDYMSFVITKNSPYTNVINYNILRLMDYGILNRLREKHFQKYVDLCYVTPNVITLKEVLSIIIIWAMGLIIAVAVLFLEIIVFRYSHRNSSVRMTKISLLCKNGCHRTIVQKISG